MLRVVLSSGIVAGLIWLSLFVGVRMDWWETLPSYSVVIILTQWIGVLLILFLLKKSIKQPKQFTNDYLLSIVLKLILFGGLIFAIIFLDREGAAKNALFFIISYITFTALEVSLLFKKLMP